MTAGSRRRGGGLLALDGLEVSPQSVVGVEGSEAGFAHGKEGPRLTVLAPSGSPLPSGFRGERVQCGEGTLLLCPADAKNLDALRGLLPWLRPRPMGRGTSAGMGDRLGLATPGHVRAVRAVGGGIAPIFAQQSIREMQRTGRTPEEVLDDATWGVFAEGWRDGFGADADHLKTAEHVDVCAAAGYTFFTFDPGDHVDDRAESADAATLRALLDGLPWDTMETTEGDLLRDRAVGRVAFNGGEVVMDREAVLRAAAKYGPAVAHAAGLYRRLEGAMGDRPFEVEVSVDETESPTTHAQHLFIAHELSRLGVRWISLAPRYAGTFEKGVDYVGDVGEFEEDFAVHAAIAREASPDGPYKLSLHSGSDKFSVYRAAFRRTEGVVHLKTAGTSYLEALRTMAGLDPDFFRRIYAFARDRYEDDRASYHVSASLESAAPPEGVLDGDLPDLLERFDERQILHVTFGSVLRDESFKQGLFEFLRANPEAYAAHLEAHFLRHLEPFSGRKLARNNQEEAR